MAPLSELWLRVTAGVAHDSPWTVGSRRVAMLLVALTVPVVALVALKSGLNSFPDETLHVATARYYLDHWLPPPMGPELAPYAGVHGVSYFMLWPPQATYFLFAKASELVFAADETRWLVYRGFCVALWTLIVFWGLREVRRAPWVMLLVGLTPQVWYIFTYFSADALSYAFAAFVVFLLAVPSSRTRRFLETGTPLSGGVLLGLCFGGLALSKMNYAPFALFAVIYCLVLMWRLRGRVVVRRVAVVAVSGAVVAAPFLTSDLITNGIAREERFEVLREELAAPNFKPSTIAAGTAYSGLGLRQRGVSVSAMFSRPWRWGHLTHRSFFGVYGTMDVFSPRGVNGVQRLVCLLLLGLAWLRRRKPLSLERWVMGAVALGLIALTLGAAFWRAWTFDFQAQGRYVFAVIPIATVYLADVSEPADEPLHWGMFVVLAICGLISILSALPDLL